MKHWPTKPLLVIATFCVIITAPQFIPAFYHWRIYEWAAASSVLDFQPRKSAAPVEEEQGRLRPDTVPANAESHRIQDAHGRMRPFYRALLRTERRDGPGVTRILHYGDSPTTADMITADVRHLLQMRFGDAGHGTYLPARPWAWYNHRDFDVDGSGWMIHPATMRAEKDGLYGLAGVSFIGRTGARSRIRLKKPGADRMIVSYLAQPGGGRLEVKADGTDLGDLATDSPESESAKETFRLPMGASEIHLRVTKGPVRLFRLSFEKDAPGVVYESLGLNGVSAGVFVSFVNEQHWATELREARGDLIIINYGTNESGFSKYVESTYGNDVRKLLRRVRRALPETPCLVMSPMDRGVREVGGLIGTVPAMPRLVALQARIADEEGCAFFNTFEAMGGPGTMGRWYMAEPRLVSADFIHPMPSGGRIVAGLFYDALMNGFNRYKLGELRRETAGMRK